MAKAHNQYDKYTATYNGRALFEKHSPDQVGIWKIYGEDPNASMGGSHYQPELGVVEGMLRDVIMYAVNLPSFWQWGAGGVFVFVGETIPKIDANSWQEREELVAEADRLEKELAVVKEKLKVMR